MPARPRPGSAPPDRGAPVWQRLANRAAPGPASREARAPRPVTAISSASPVPVTSSPSPHSQSRSVARSRSPAARLPVCSGGPCGTLMTSAARTAAAPACRSIPRGTKTSWQWMITSASTSAGLRPGGRKVFPADSRRRATSSAGLAAPRRRPSSYSHAATLNRCASSPGQRLAHRERSLGVAHHVGHHVADPPACAQARRVPGGPGEVSDRVSQVAPLPGDQRPAL